MAHAISLLTGWLMLAGGAGLIWGPRGAGIVLLLAGLISILARVTADHDARKRTP